MSTHRGVGSANDTRPFVHLLREIARVVLQIRERNTTRKSLKSSESYSLNFLEWNLTPQKNENIATSEKEWKYLHSWIRMTNWQFFFALFFGSKISIF